MDTVSAFNEASMEFLESWGPEGDFSRVHMLNPAIFRMLGDVRGKRILDAGCGQGYLSRMLAARGATVVGVEPARAMYEYAVERERESRLGIRYVRADLGRLPALGEPFDAVVANMVLIDIADWTSAMHNCVEALVPGGLFVFSINHPCFEESTSEWSAKSFVEVREYLAEYERPTRFGVNYHRTLATYLNETIRLGCRFRAFAEPGIDERTAAECGGGAERLVHVPSFLVMAAEKS